MEEGKERRYVRHSSSIPINIEIEEVASSQQEYLNDIGLGGLCFKSKQPVKNGTVVHVKIPLVRPVFQTKGKVVWCSRSGDHFDVGLQFVDQCDSFRMRMAEQVCHIEEYKKKILKLEGRHLTGTQAALEWIQKYSREFPHHHKEE